MLSNEYKETILKIVSHLSKLNLKREIDLFYKEVVHPYLDECEKYIEQSIQNKVQKMKHEILNGGNDE